MSINERIKEHFNETYPIWQEYKSGLIDRTTMATSINAIMSSTHSHEHLYRSFSSIDLGMSLNSPDVAAVAIETAKKRTEVARLGKQIRQLAWAELGVKALQELAITPIQFDEELIFSTPTMQGEGVCIASDIHFRGKAEELVDLLQGISNTGCKSVLFNGDIIQGFLRDNDFYNPTINPLDQATQFVAIVTQWLNDEVAAHIEEVIILPGNHDEIRHSQNIKGGLNCSYAQVIASMLEANTKKVVRFTKKAELQFRGEVYTVIHGDGFRGINAIKNYYGNSPVIHGHYHNLQIEGNRVSLPSCCSGNSYEKSLGITPTPPAIAVIKENSLEVIYYDVSK